MEREHRVPVEQTEQPAGPEQSCLVEDALALVLWLIRNSSNASPGNRISARNETQQSGSKPATRQKSSASP